MVIETKERHAGESVLISALPLPFGFTPEGVEIALIDQRTLSLVEHAVPGGRDVFVHLLYYATISPQTTMQRSLFAATGESNDEAIALISSVEVLAKSPNSPFRSPDAYQRRLLALESLQVVRRIFHRSYTELRIPLRSRVLHIPSLLASLWELHEQYKDEKVKQLARKVAKRLQTGEFLTSSPQNTSTTLDPELAPVLGVLDGMLKAHGLQEDIALLTNACTIIAGLLLPEKYGQVGEKMGEFLATLGKRRPAARKKMGDSGGKVGDSVDSQASRGDQFQAPQEGRVGEFVATESPISEDKPQKRRTCRAKKGDVEAIFRMNSPECGSNGQMFVTKGDSVAPVSIIVLSSKDITQKGETIIDTATTEALWASPSESAPVQVDNRLLEEIRREAKFYESFFDNGRSRKWTGSLINVLRATPTEAKRQASVGAVYYSYFPQPDGRTVYSPGGWFTSACRRYAQPGATVPSEVRAWSETNLPLKEIRRRVKEGSRLPSEVALPWEHAGETGEVKETVKLCGQQGDQYQAQEWNSASFDEVSVSPEMVYPLPCATGNTCMGTWMGREQASRLRDHMVCEGANYRLKAVVQPGRGESWTVVVTWPEQSGEVEIVNEEDWVDYWTSVKECLDEQG